MSDAAPDLVPSEAPDPAVERMEVRLRVLQEITQIGMYLMRDLCVDVAIEQRLKEGTLRDAFGDKLSSEALVAAGERPARKEAADDFHKVSRSVRLTVALERQIDEALAALRAGIVVEQEQKAEKRVKAQRDAEVAAFEAEQARHVARREKVFDIIFEAAEIEIDDAKDLTNLELALTERLAGDPAYVVALADLPLEETVRRLCADLQLNPDWSLWAGDGWAPKEPFHRPARSCYERPSRMPSAAFAKSHAALQERLRRLHGDPLLE
jgi:hypothetical protein